MSFEPGGRSDKYGNEYENKYLAKLFLRLVNEKIASVIVEPLGPNSDSVEYLAEQTDGSIKHYQCKGSNTTHSSWSVSDLRKFDVFKRAKSIVMSSGDMYYVFISPLQYNELDELCKRARTNSSSDEFVIHQLTNKKIRALFNDCATEFGLDKNNPQELNYLIYILSHCYFEQYATGIEADQDLDAQVGVIFTGKASAVRVLLEQYANDTGKYGVKITANDIVHYMSTRDIHVRNYCRDKGVLSRISTLNNTHWDKYKAIYDHLLHRPATDKLVTDISSCYSVILHGKAGAGKSGCLQEIINYLEEKQILYLAVKLDKTTPQTSADVYGKQLGLPESPVHCLTTLSAGKPCVLILDQLDSLRWTSNHSRDALAVCKELIAQAEAVNKYCKGHVCIIFASRTFDLENDKGLKDLFDTKEGSTALNWRKTNVDVFTEKDLIQIIGTDYNNFSLRLKKLLLTPSSLFVWSMLEKNAKKNSITSVFELMNEWWKQILKQCELAGVSESDAVSCRNMIVERMENSSTAFLPIALFSDHPKVIEVFVSNGLLNSNSSTKSISFTHQSFLDYFVVSSVLKDVYSGKEIAKLLGGRNDQTPFVRYRLLTVLQNLLEYNRSTFVKQAYNLLRSDFVRYYFKCTVFEIIGQCATPDEAIHEIVQTYSQDPEWCDYIIQVVTYGHVPYVMQFSNQPKFDWLSDLSLSLLRSINNTAPDYVTENLRPYALKDGERDRKIFGALCHDATNDSEDMFHFRLQLLRKNPILFNGFWGFSDLLKHPSLRAIEMFDTLLETFSEHKPTQIYLGEKETVVNYARKNYKPMVNRLFSRICEVSCNFLPQWPFYGLYEYRVWIACDHNRSAARQVVEAVETAFEEYAKSEPENLLMFIHGVRYPISAVGHELIMHALSYLCADFGNEVIKWLLTDFKNRVFVFSADDRDYLFYAKRLIEKFSLTCTNECFQQLEGSICNWQESKERLINTYKSRCEVNKSGQYSPVYYSYWGHFQKTLLPSMDKSRLSKYSIELIGVLERNTWIHLPYYYSGLTVGPAKSVISPVDSHTERLSDKRWLQIISTPQDKMKDRWRGNDDGPSYIEVSHSSFSSALGIQAKVQPERFAKLSLLFPPNCYPEYVVNVLHALSDDNFGELSIELLSSVIRRFSLNAEKDIHIAILRMIENHAYKAWPDDIIDLVEEIVLTHPQPAESEYAISSSTDPEHKSVRTLLTNSINCARGCGAHAIAALLWNHRNLGERFKITISAACTDLNDAVRFAVMSCILPYYNIDKEFAKNVYKTIISSDLRMIASPQSWDIFHRVYQEEPDYYRDKLIEACSSDVEDLAEDAARLLCAISIFFDDQAALDHITLYKFSDKQQSEICLQAASSFNIFEYHDRSEKILLHLVDNSLNELFGLNHLFFERCISIQRDEQFLIHLMQSRHNVRLSHAFLDYLYESDEDIRNYSSVLAALGNNLSNSPSEWKNQLVVSDLIKCVVRLFDRGQEDLEIKAICLDIWDNLFKSNLNDIKPLSDMIDNFE